MCKRLNSAKLIKKTVPIFTFSLTRMKTCASCLRKEKVFLVDLNLFKIRRGRGTIKFKQCKKRIGEYCVSLLLDKIVIRL